MSQLNNDRYITLAIHTYDYAMSLKALLESEGIEVELNNVNLSHPVVSAGIRVRIREIDLPLALRIVENREIFALHSSHESPCGGAIVVPVDFSDYSYATTLTAFRLASSHNADIVLLHAYIDPAISSELQLSDAYSFNQAAEIQTSRRILSEENAEMDRYISRIKDDIKAGIIPPVKFTSVVTEGVPEEVIIQYAKENNPIFMVMSTREALRKEKDLIGSVTAEVLDSCRTTTITIPSNCDSSSMLNPEKITMFCNLDQGDIIALDTLRRLFPDNKASVTLVHLPSHRDRFRDTANPMETLVNYCRLNYPAMKFKSGKVDHASIMSNLTSEQTDLIVVAAKKKNIFARIFNPGIAHRILFRADVPMMTIPV